MPGLVQISVQDSDAASADHIAGYDGAFARKRALAAEVVRHKLPLTVNAVVHRANIDRNSDMVEGSDTRGGGRGQMKSEHQPHATPQTSDVTIFRASRINDPSRRRRSLASAVKWPCR
jgi:hypothetical protein